MTGTEFIDFTLSTFNAMDMLSPREAGTAWLRAFAAYTESLQTVDAVDPSVSDPGTPTTRDQDSSSSSMASVPVSALRGLVQRWDDHEWLWTHGEEFVRDLAALCDQAEQP
jgi:hypothetical protein